MKILSVGYALEKASGVTTFVEQTAAGLRALGHEVDVVDILKDADRTGEVGNYDVVHLHCLWQLHKYAVAARKAKVPIVWSTHGMTAPWAMKHKWWKKKLAWWLYQRRDLKGTVAIHCTTEQETKWNEALGFGNCFVAPLGTSELFDHVEQVEHAEKRLLFVGRVHPVKGLANLIRAWKLVVSGGEIGVGDRRRRRGGELVVSTEGLVVSGEEVGVGGRVGVVSRRRRSGGEWRLRIVGPDEAGHQSELESLVRELRLGDSVEFAGPKFGEDLSREYEDCDGLVLPSFTENFGATVVDAMAHGKPVITSTFTPWREVKERGCGWWVSNEPESLACAIRELMEMDDGARDAMGERGIGLVKEKYEWGAVSGKLEAAYAEALRRSGND